MSPLLKSPPRRRVVWPWVGKGVFSLSSVLPVTKIVPLRSLFPPCQELMWLVVSLYCCGMLGKGLGEHWCAMGCGSWLPRKACDLERVKGGVVLGLRDQMQLVSGQPGLPLWSGGMCR